jgi:hypothetical protein
MTRLPTIDIENHTIYRTAIEQAMKVNPIHFAGRKTYGTVDLVPEGNETLELGVKVEEICVPPYKLYGVIPLSNSFNCYECCIDHLEVYNNG